MTLLYYFLGSLFVAMGGGGGQRWEGERTAIVNHACPLPQNKVITMKGKMYQLCIVIVIPIYKFLPSCVQ